MDYLNYEDSSLFAELNSFSERVSFIYRQAIADYHITDQIDAVVSNPYFPGRIRYLLYQKAWIDTVQWHVEDKIRNPKILPEKALELKRKIDRLNQERTDTVEQIDNRLLIVFRDVKARLDARINTESPAWALDRLSILILKIYHMSIETERKDASSDHIRRCNQRLLILHEQQKDMLLSINELLQDVAAGHRYMKTYRQMKMYNDPSLNPILYNTAKDQ